MTGPATNSQTGARRYTGAEFVIRLWRINGTSVIDLKPEPPKPDS